MSTTLYQLGFNVGKLLRKIQGQKRQVEVVYDQINGSDTNDGLESPTSNFVNAIYTANQFYQASIKPQNIQAHVVHGAYVTISDMIHFEIDASKLNNPLEIVFSVIDENSQALGSIWFSNSYIVFKNVQFTLPETLQPLTEKYLPSIPLIFKSCTVRFEQCIFYNYSNSEFITFMNLENTTVIAESCKFLGNTFTLATCLSHPSLVSTVNCDNQANCTIQDPTSKWIKTT